MVPTRTSCAVWFALALLPLAVTPARGQASAEAWQEKRRAFLVACQNYPENQLSKLEFTHNDIKDFQEALLHTGFAAEDITVLYDPDGAMIRAQLQQLQRAGENNTLIVAFAGHGVQFEE